MSQYTNYKVGEALKHFRTTSSEEVAKRLGVSQPTYHRYELGKAKIPFPVVLDFCDIHGITITKFHNQMEKVKVKVVLC